MTQIEPGVTGKKYHSDQSLARRWDCHPRTVKRMKKDPRLNFPPADLIINGRELRLNETIECWERERITRSAKD